jgi:S1-C subfamily serine protease
MNKKDIQISALLVTIFVLFFGIITTTFVTMQQANSQGSSNNMNAKTSNQNETLLASSPPNLLNTIFKQVENSVVQITSKVPIPSNIPTPSPNPAIPPQNATALGSGFIFDNQGHIVTNSHVVGDAKIVDITFADGNTSTAKIIGNDIYSDIAVAQIVRNKTHSISATPILKPITIANSSNLQVGDQVIAIGNPFGLSDTMTTGIVSGIGRLLPSATTAFSIPEVIQTDAPINPGNSGGPLLNIQGQVVGMNTAILSITGGFGGLGFAIPSNALTKVVTNLIQKGYYLHPYLGLSGATLTSDIASNVTGIPRSTSFKGIYVNSITKDGPADKAGIHGSTTDQYGKKNVGDIITAVDGHPIIRMDDLISYIDQHKSVGSNMTLTVYRNGQTADLKTTLTARPSPIPFLPSISTPPSVPPPNSPSPSPPSSRPPSSSPSRPNHP